MSSIAQPVAAAMALSLLISCVAADPSVTIAPTPTRVVPPTAAANIHRYVAEHRGWRRTVYYIQRYPNEHGYAVFEVVHRDDESPAHLTVGRSKSFTLYCDPQTYKVIKEMWEQ